MDSRCLRDLDHRGNRCIDVSSAQREGVYFGFQGDLNLVDTENPHRLRCLGHSCALANEALEAERPEKSPESSDGAFSNDGSVILRAFFDDAILLWLLTTWLIKGLLSKTTGVLSISYCPHVRALTDINDRGKVELPEQRSRAQPETVQGQPTFPRSFMSVNARVV